MDKEPELERAGRAYTAAREIADRAQSDLKVAVVQAYREGVGTMEIARRSGQAREVIRRIRVAAERAGELDAEKNPG